MRAEMFNPESYEYQYMKALDECFRLGFEDKNERTGHFTKRLEQVIFKVNLAEHFPIIQSKKVFFKSAVDEILWIMQRQSNKREDINSGIWDKWINEEGTVGKCYGYQIAPNVRSEKDCYIKPKLVTPPNDIRLPIKLWEEVEISEEDLKADKKVGKVYFKDTENEFRVIKYNGLFDNGAKNYSIQFKNTGFIFPQVSVDVVLDTLENGDDPIHWNRGIRDVNSVGYEGDSQTYEGVTNLNCNADKNDTLKDCLFEIWRHMIEEVYNEDGTPKEEGVFVDAHWHSWINFLRDVRYLPNWKLASENLSNFTLSREYFKSNCYSKETCVWLSKSEEDDYKYLDSYSEPDSNNKYLRIKLNINQISKLINTIKNEPSSRRMVVTLWKPDELDEGTLEPCAFTSMWSVVNGVLNCTLVQRSGDSMLGVPFNTTQYAVLTHLVAKSCNLKVGTLVHVIQDFHIYDNAMDGAKLQLDRYEYLKFLNDNYDDMSDRVRDGLLSEDTKERLSFKDTTLDDLIEILNTKPSLELPNKDFYDFTLEDIVLKDYKSLGAIKIDSVK